MFTSIELDLCFISLSITKIPGHSIKQRQEGSERWRDDNLTCDLILKEWHNGEFPGSSFCLMDPTLGTKEAGTIDNVYVLPKPYGEIFTPNVMISGGGVFEK